MLNQLHSFTDAFFTYTAWYCGHGEVIDRFVAWLEKQERHNEYGCDHVTIDANVRGEFKDIGMLLSCLIIMFGDYGTSPQYGWIEQVDNALNWLRYVRMYWREDER